VKYTFSCVLFVLCCRCFCCYLCW